MAQSALVTGTAAPPNPAAQRLAALIDEVSATNDFQRERLGATPVRSLDDLRAIAPVDKRDLLTDQAAHPPFGRNLTYPADRYLHLHQTSGTAGSTLRVVDTAQDWAWWCDCLRGIYAAAGVGAGDLVALAHSFGPYIQFWASYDGAGAVGANRVALGGMDSRQRLETILEYRATTLTCTPSYAIRLANVAHEHQLIAALDPVQRIICTGEPGASLPAVRERIESAWNARCFDHAGLSEVGAYGMPCDVGGVHLNEREFHVELVTPGGEDPVADGEIGELIITALGRTGFPAIRYRTGDAARISPDPCPAGHPGRWLPDGVLGRTDDMVVIRGMNVFPSAIEQALRDAGEIGEFRITFYHDARAMDEVKVEVELVSPERAREIQARLRTRLGLRLRIVPLKPGVLPPAGNKARRVVDARAGGDHART